MKIVRIAAASGAALSLCILVALGVHFYFQDNTEIQFDPTASMPTVLLPVKDKVAGVGTRALDGKGGAVDTYKLASGFELVVYVRDLIANTRDRELTYYPPRPESNDEHGPLFSEKLYAKNGRGLLSERFFDPDQHLIRTGKLVKVEKTWFYQVDEFNAGGIQVKAQVLRLAGGVENESSFRDNGTRRETKKAGYGDNNWEVTRYADDGIRIIDQEMRSYGRYRVVDYYDDGVTKKVESQRSPSSVLLNLYKPDGSMSMSVQVLDNYDKSFTFYHANGKRKLVLTWYIDSKKVKDGKGEVLWHLRDINEMDEAEESTRTIRLNEDGSLNKVIYFKSATNPQRFDVEYKDGKPVKIVRWHEGSSERDESDNPGNVPAVQIPAQWQTMPDYPAPRADKINVDAETPHDHGM